MYGDAMRAQGFVEVEIHIDYVSALANEVITDEVQSLWVLPVAPDRLLIKESSGFFDEYKLFFGDEIIVEPIGEKNYKLTSVVEPSPMCHFFSIGSGSPTGLTQVLHELGGEWETEMGGLTTFHIPRHQLDAFQARFGMNPRSGQELFSGVQPWGKDDEKPPEQTKQQTTPKLEPVSGPDRHLVLLGDSIFDNAAYVPDEPAVIDHIQSMLSKGWRATLVARDGDMVTHVSEQIPYIPVDATHLVLSIGGNDALNSIESLSRPTDSVRLALGHLNEIRSNFRRAYRAMLWQLLDLQRPLVVCTIYDAVPSLSPDLQTALCLFNDTIVREANAAHVPIIDLRNICTEAGDYSAVSPIEPSAQDGEKIAKAIAAMLG